jgi:hypothetical protein
MKTQKSNRNGFTVAELISELQKAPQDAVVVIRSTAEEQEFYRVHKLGAVATRKHFDNRLGKGLSGVYPPTKSVTLLLD